MEQRKLKKLTSDNWNTQDAVTGSFSDAGEWAQYFLSFELSDTVPNELREKFEVSRSLLLYAYYFYPLFTLGLERIIFLYESAISNKYKIFGGPKPQKTTLKKKIDWLFKEGYISQELSEKLQERRDSRNYVTHADDQQIFPPAAAGIVLKVFVSEINMLFEDQVT